MKEILSDEKKNDLVVHLGYYGPLLTDTQREMTQMYVDDDYSLSEIAGQFGVTRQSVCDTIRKAGRVMARYEEKLRLMDRAKGNIALIQRALKNADGINCTGDTAVYKSAVIEDLKALLIKEETDYGV